MKIKNPKDFWAGLMFLAFGVFFAVYGAIHYQMGTAVRMGPAYFPTMLGGLLTVLGAVVLAQSLATGDGEKLKLPFNIVDLAIVVAIYVAGGYAAQFAGISSDWVIVGATAVICVLAIRYRPDARALVLISAACLFYGYLMKPLGLVGATAALVFVSAYGGHEFKWKEVIILYVILMFFSWAVFVKGLTLPFPIWPEAFG
jgi:hypothetical protein